MYKVLRLKDVKDKTGLAKSTIYKKIGEGEFPNQFSLSGRSVGWLESDIDKWIGDRVLVAANDNGAANDNTTTGLDEPSSCMELVSKSQIMIGANDNLK
jgi:prophage regulatory protein